MRSICASERSGTVSPAVSSFPITSQSDVEVSRERDIFTTTSIMYITVKTHASGFYLYTGGRGGSFPPKLTSFPPKQTRGSCTFLTQTGPFLRHYFGNPSSELPPPKVKILDRTLRVTDISGFNYPGLPLHQWLVLQTQILRECASTTSCLPPVLTTSCC